MIKLNVIEPSFGQPIKTIYFIDEQDYCFRVGYLLDDELVLDEVQEFNKSKQKINETLFDGSYNVLAYINYLRDSADTYIGKDEYQVIGGHHVKICSMRFSENLSGSEGLRQNWFNASGELVYYSEPDIDGLKIYKSNGEEYKYEEQLHIFFSEVKLKGYSDVLNEHLKRIIKENT
ncbi:hypothetical protein F993_01506 [Acinetobacter proteolyticus]|uniref:Uncharacterized protein n=1 Tax=Acinetobacter proteolyticus TaxID=1776741 RepID=A0ABN0JG48_9GAMM|nr:hypothetical protein [Acinetobacter proteolyticus]ENU24190.1 hypothetical protein F993_01506 [Acinetobacter proteolyticus]